GDRTAETITDERDLGHVDHRILDQRVEAGLRACAQELAVLAEDRGLRLDFIKVLRHHAEDVGRERHVTELRPVLEMVLGVVGHALAVMDHEYRRAPAGHFIVVGHVGFELDVAVAVFDPLGLRLGRRRAYGKRESSGQSGRGYAKHGHFNPPWCDLVEGLRGKLARTSGRAVRADLLRWVPPTAQGTGCERSTAAPRRYTAEILRVLVMSSSGLASSTMKSALLPASSVPASAIRRNWAPLRVAATTTCAGVIPASTMSSISSCGAHALLPSVPIVMRTPAAFIRFRLRAWMPWNCCAFGRSVFSASSLANSSGGRPGLSQLRSTRTPRSGRFGVSTMLGRALNMSTVSSSTSRSRTPCAKASRLARISPLASSMLKMWAVARIPSLWASSMAAPYCDGVTFCTLPSRSSTQILMISIFLEKFCRTASRASSSLLI